MTAQDRQKLAETVRAAFAAHYRTGSYADLGMAMQDVQNDLLAALAEPCQECETLRAQGRGEVTAPSSQPDARTARDEIESRANEAIRLLRETNPQGIASKPHICIWSDELSQSTSDVLALLAQVERLERERDRAEERVREAAKLFGVCDGGRYWNDWKESHRILVGRAEATEARAQRYREALTHYADEGNDSHDTGCLRHPMHWPDENDGKPGYERIIGGPNAKCTCAYAVARRALSADPLVCRDPDLCWGKGTCPRDPACDE